MPMTFPKGKWEITGVVWQKDSFGKSQFDYNTYGPCKIQTNAFQAVNVWELDSEQDYLRETDKKVKDSCYWLHYSTSSSTLGCIRLSSESEATTIGKLVEASLFETGACYLEVV